MQPHQLDVYPVPKDKSPLFINEPRLIDRSLDYSVSSEPDSDDDNIRIYIPMDLNKEAILRRLDSVIAHYQEANEENEMDFSVDVNMLISQIEIYDQVWYVRQMPSEGVHSQRGKELVAEFVARLEEIPDGCAECFPFETIDMLKEEYLDD